MARKLLMVAIVLTGIVATSCKEEVKKEPKLAFEEAPEWSQEAVWYQVFVERFRNGDTSNDPTLEDVNTSYPYQFPENWEVSKWDSQWFKLNPWEEDFYEGDFYTAVQSRRYGGDLQGLLEKLDYLADLGITALYINPVNYSPSLHKFDATDYAHVDPTFGPDPEGDSALMKTENPLDPSTWVWTEADKLFVKVIDEAHKRNMRVVLDYSWNHTGVDHIFWKDILENQQNSPYADFYEIDAWDDPATEENEFAYTGWAGVSGMPELKKVDVVDRPGHGLPYEGNIHPKVKEYIFNVSKKWMDPLGNGDVSKGLDGYRLDVADQIGLDFWREYRTFVRSVNPEMYLIGEIWWEEWPDKLMDPRPYMQGDIFDAVMHYQWYKPARRYFANANGGYAPSEFVNQMKSVFEGYPEYSKKAMMNMSSSHDAPRLGTSFYNKNPYKNMTRDTYKFNKPDAGAWEAVKLFLVHQYTYIGSPQIWQGDEMGMWGGDDPDDRKPLLWKEFEFESEDRNGFEQYDFIDEVKFDEELFNYYKELIAIRKANPTLIHGSVSFDIIDDANNILGYSRAFEGEKIFVVFNMGKTAQNISLKTSKTDEMSDLLSESKFFAENGKLNFKLEGKTAVILK